MWNNKYIQAVLGLLLLGLIVFGVYTLRNMIGYVLISVFLAFVGRPLAHRLKGIRIGRFHLPDALAAALVLFIEFGVLGGLFVLMVPTLVDELSHWSQVDAGGIVQYAQVHLQSLDGLAEQLGLKWDAEELRSNLLASMNLDVAQVGSVAERIFGGLGSMVIALFSILFISFFFIKEEGLSQKMLYGLVLKEQHEKLDRILPKIKELLTRYFVGILLQITLITTLVSLGLWLAGIEKILFIALFAGLINVIPYVGPLIGAFVGLILVAAQNLHLPFDELGLLIGLSAMVFMATQLIDNFILQPLIYSNSVKAHPLEIFLVITASGTLAGIGGMILAVPIYSVFRIAAKEFLYEFQIIRKLTRDV
jgi:predicted PurR-regulated permease PerM